MICLRLTAFLCAAISVPTFAQDPWDPRHPDAVRETFRRELARGPAALPRMRELASAERPDLRALGLAGIAAIDPAAFHAPDMVSTFGKATRRERRVLAARLDPRREAERQLLAAWVRDPYEDVQRAAAWRLLEADLPQLVSDASVRADGPWRSVYLAFVPDAFAGPLARAEIALSPAERLVWFHTNAEARLPVESPFERLQLGADAAFRPAVQRCIALEPMEVSAAMLNRLSWKEGAPWCLSWTPVWLGDGAASFLLDRLCTSPEERRVFTRDVVRVLERLETFPTGALLQAFHATANDDDLQRRLLALAAREPARHVALLREALTHPVGKVREHAFILACGLRAFDSRELLEVAKRETEERHLGILGRALATRLSRDEEFGIEGARRTFHELADGDVPRWRRLALHGLSAVPNDPRSFDCLTRIFWAGRGDDGASGHAVEVLRVCFGYHGPAVDEFLEEALATIGRTEETAFETVVRELDPARRSSLLEPLFDSTGLLDEARDEIAIALAQEGSLAARAHVERRFVDLSWERQGRALQALVRHERADTVAFLCKLERERLLELDWIVETWAALEPADDSLREVTRHLDPAEVTDVRLAAWRSLASFGAEGARLVVERLRFACEREEGITDEELVALLDVAERLDDPRVVPWLATLHWRRFARDGDRALRSQSVQRHLLEVIERWPARADESLRATFGAEGAAAIEPRDLASWLALHGEAFPRTAVHLAQWLLACEPEVASVRANALETLARDPVTLGGEDAVFIVHAARVAREVAHAEPHGRRAPRATFLDLENRIDRFGRWAVFEDVVHATRTPLRDEERVGRFEHRLRLACLDARATFLVLVEALDHEATRERAREHARRFAGVAPRGFWSAALTCVVALSRGEETRAILALEDAAERAEDGFHGHVVDEMRHRIRSQGEQGFRDWVETWRLAVMDNPPDP
ncbi:MAG: hypothetical protein H6833_12755 [Planctomycetes bacterium]|nr:hypothetical protein [Planctomycetota bacterium]